MRRQYTSHAPASCSKAEDDPACTACHCDVREAFPSMAHGLARHRVSERQIGRWEELSMPPACSLPGGGAIQS